MTTVPAEDIERLPAIRATTEQVDALFHEDMRGCVKSITVDFLNHTATVTTTHGCVSMGACIATVMMLDPAVENIQTINGNGWPTAGQHCSKDTQYIKHPEQGWFAIHWQKDKPSKGDYYGTEFVVKRLQSQLLA